MSILVDTSVWIDFANGLATPEADLLASSIQQEEQIVTCGVVVAEFLKGLRSPRSVKIFTGHFRDMAWVSPQEPDSYEEAAALYRELRRRGVTIRSTIDCLVVRLAEENGCSILARDRDIRLVLDSGLVNVSSPTTGV